MYIWAGTNISVDIYARALLLEKKPAGWAFHLFIALTWPIVLPCWIWSEYFA
ncbi:MAG: hypothetical protein WC704_16525 [Sphingomonas sp.]